MTDALARARADLEQGRLWKARDRLAGLMATRTDDEVLDLLGQVHFQMRDLPAAGALWFVTGRDDADARAAIDAWHERFGGAEERWRSIPRARRLSPQEDRVRQLERAAKHAAQARWDAKRERIRAAGRKDGFDWEGLVIGAVLFTILALMVVGGITVLRWIVT